MRRFSLVRVFHKINGEEELLSAVIQNFRKLKFERKTD